MLLLNGEIDKDFVVYSLGGDAT